MVHWDSPYLTIHWDPGTKCVHLEWKGFVHGEKGRTGLNMGLDFFKTKATDRWLADTRQLKVVPEEDLKWINEDWFPRAIAAGVRRMALVVPESVLAKMSIRRLMSKVKDEDIETAYFGSVEDAKTWLRTGV
jgi:hypothetical protein